MSAAADSSAAGDSSRLEQPNDAVAMDSINESARVSDPSKANPANESRSDDGAAANPTSDSNNATGPAATDAAAPQADQSGGSAPPASSKGKDKDEEAPQPPLKERERQDSIMAIGPAQDEIKTVSQGTEDGPVCNITLLLTSGSRHPYKINARYLSRRNVPIPEETENGLPDPFSISVYTLKELILREWRNDWEAKPASPSSIRLIHFGKLLDDNVALKNYQFIPDSPNVVHMSIRPQDLDEEEPKGGAKNSSHAGADGQRQRVGGCCVVL